jgi:hypothetical protein
MTRKKPYHKMTTAELAEATKEFERDAPLEQVKPLSPELKAKWERARRHEARPARPRVRKGARAVLVTIERGLLAHADTFAAAQGISRSELIARGLIAVTGAAPAKSTPAGASGKPRNGSIARSRSENAPRRRAG